MGLRGTLAPLLLVVVLVAGCSRGEDPAATPEDQGSADGDAVTGVVAPADLPEPPRVRGAEGAVADVETGECATREGRQQVTGSVTSTAERPTDYVITLSWITDASDVRGRGVAVVRDLAPGDSADWELTAEVADGATQCVPNVVRGEVSGR